MGHENEIESTEDELDIPSDPDNLNIEEDTPDIPKEVENWDAEGDHSEMEFMNLLKEKSKKCCIKCKLTTNWWRPEEEDCYRDCLEKDKELALT